MLPLTSLQSCLTHNGIPMCNDIFVIPNTGTEILTSRHEASTFASSAYIQTESVIFILVHGCLQISVGHEQLTTFLSDTQRRICLQHYTTLQVSILQNLSFSQISRLHLCMFVYTTMRETISTNDPPGSSRRERDPYLLGLVKGKHWQQCDVATPDAPSACTAPSTASLLDSWEF